MVLKYGPSDNNISTMMISDDGLMELDPFLLFTSAIRSNQTKEKYQRRLDIFFDFIALPKGSLKERCVIFIKNSKENPTYYPLNSVFRFIMYQKERLQKKEIVVSTIHNYLKPIKLLCEMNDIHVKWKKITIGLPKERRYAEDRAPTIEEIQKLIEYPDRRIKTIISTMISSGIRLGAWEDLKWKHIQPIEKNRKITVCKLFADGAYDGNDIFRCLADSGIHPCIKVRKNARVRLKTNHIIRNLSVLAQRNDLQRWKDSISYGRRWIAETVFSSIKRTFGEYVYSVKFKNMIQEMMLKASLYNKIISI